MDIDEWRQETLDGIDDLKSAVKKWRQETLDGVDDLKSAVEKWKKLLGKDLKSCRESMRYRVRNLKARTQKQVADLKQETQEGEKADVDKNTGRKSSDAQDLLGDTARGDNAA